MLRLYLELFCSILLSHLLISSHLISSHLCLSVAVQGPPKSLFPLWQCGSSSDSLVTLGCITQGLASADGLTFSWMDESGNALTDIVQYPAVLADGSYTSVSQARVEAADWNGSKQFKCQVKNSLGVLYKDLRKPEGRRKTSKKKIHFHLHNQMPLYTCCIQNIKHVT